VNLDTKLGTTAIDFDGASLMREFGAESWERLNDN